MNNNEFIFDGSKVNRQLSFNCEKKWVDLESTDFSDIRYCANCKKKVFMVKTDDEFLDAVKSEKCMAIQNKYGSISHVGFVPRSELLLVSEQKSVEMTCWS